MAKSETIVRKRMAPQEREAQILSQAVGFFAEHGFDGNTRDLARGLGITQPLLYRYFPTKEALIERVYEAVFDGAWNPLWEAWLDDQSQPLADRLRRFYRSYARNITTYEWIRLFMFAGLRGLDFSRRWVTDLRPRVFARIVRDLRAEAGGPTLDVLAISEAEFETMWGLHASIYYLGVRRHIYHVPIPDDQDADIDRIVTVFLNGVYAVVAKA